MMLPNCFGAAATSSTWSRVNLRGFVFFFLWMLKSARIWPSSSCFPAKIRHCWSCGMSSSSLILAFTQSTVSEDSIPSVRVFPVTIFTKICIFSPVFYANREATEYEKRILQLQFTSSLLVKCSFSLFNFSTV